MADETPGHRSAFAARSGDTHVIGKDGKAVNVDQQAREAAATPKKPTGKRKALRKAAKRSPPQSPTSAPTSADGTDQFFGDAAKMMGGSPKAAG